MKTFFLMLISLISFSITAEELRPYTVYLREGTVLTKIKDKSEIILPKGIYAKVLELNPNRRDLFNVYDKFGVVQYQVTAEGMVEIADDIKILPGIDAEKIYPPKSIFKTENKFAQFDSQLSLHFDTLQLSKLNNIYNDQITTVLATRYEARTLYVTDLPVEFGFSLNYQSAYWKNDFEEVKLSILSLGPQFKYKFYENEDFNVHALLGAEIAPIYQGSSAQYTDKYSAVLFDLGVESQWHSPLGILTLGSHFRHHDIALTESNRPNLELVPKGFSLNSLGFMIGYKIEWNL
ncbi:MAG: hypothetical protein H7281_12390 [Bacteriovorax sp.]|nr:hypothetical protein [Bacteriovorax sp.]